MAQTVKVKSHYFLFPDCSITLNCNLLLLPAERKKQEVTSMPAALIQVEQQKCAFLSFLMWSEFQQNPDATFTLKEERTTLTSSLINSWAAFCDLWCKGVTVQTHPAEFAATNPTGQPKCHEMLQTLYKIDANNFKLIYFFSRLLHLKDVCTWSGLLKMKIIYSSTDEKCSRLTWQADSKVLRTWSTVTHCFIWKCNTEGWEEPHQHSDRRIDLGQLKTRGVSGYDITEIFQMSDGEKKKKIEIERYYHDKFFFYFFNLGGNKCAIPWQRPAGAAKGTSICLPHVETLRILTGFNKPRKAILLLLQSALQTHLYLCKPRCRQAHMQHPTTRRREMLTAPDLHPVPNKNLYCLVGMTVAVINSTSITGLHSPNNWCK